MNPTFISHEGLTADERPSTWFGGLAAWRLGGGSPASPARRRDSCAVTAHQAAPHSGISCPQTRADELAGFRIREANRAALCRPSSKSLFLAAVGAIAFAASLTAAAQGYGYGRQQHPGFPRQPAVRPQQPPAFGGQSPSGFPQQPAAQPQRLPYANPQPPADYPQAPAVGQPRPAAPSMTQQHLFDLLKQQYFAQGGSLQGGGAQRQEIIRGIQGILSRDYGVHCQSYSQENYGTAQSVVAAMDVIVRIQHNDNEADRRSLTTEMQGIRASCENSQYGEQVVEFLKDFSNESAQWQQELLARQEEARARQAQEQAAAQARAKQEQERAAIAQERARQEQGRAATETGCRNCVEPLARPEQERAATEARIKKEQEFDRKYFLYSAIALFAIGLLGIAFGKKPSI